MVGWQVCGWCVLRLVSVAGGCGRLRVAVHGGAVAILMKQVDLNLIEPSDESTNIVEISAYIRGVG